MELTIEQSCPACGAAITLQEDDRLIKCEYCDVPNFRVQQKLPRYVLAARLPRHVAEDELLYVPYLRFKGSIYYCQGKAVRHKLIDTTRVGCALDSLPVSLGLRPQAMKMLPVTEQLMGRYVRQSVKAEKIFSEAARLTTLFAKDRKNRVIHRAYIGETVSRVYLPVYVSHDILYDGVNHQELGPGALAQELSARLLPYDPQWEPRFISTICPECGDVMQGSSDTLVMNCRHCETLWLEEHGRFVRLEYRALPPLESSARFIPFWQIEPEIENQQLATLADFLELTNQPVVIQREHRQRKLAFLIPAFKMNPSAFLQAARNMTVLQPALHGKGQAMLDNIYPVTLAHREAVEVLKSVLAASAVSARRVMALLPSLVFHVRRKKLLYLPFRDAGHDWIQHHTGVSIASAALRFGRKL